MRLGVLLHLSGVCLDRQLVLCRLLGQLGTQATRIERGANPVVHTPNGRVKAKFIVVAGNAYLGNLVPELAAKTMPCGSQVIATEPLATYALPGSSWIEPSPITVVPSLRRM